MADPEKGNTEHAAGPFEPHKLANTASSALSTATSGYEDHAACFSTQIDPPCPHDMTTTAPEKKITLFALRLAILEKSASGLGTLAFVWATVVLLGGFAITLEKADFWCVTVILLIQGERIFSRSHELEWQHETTLSLPSSVRSGVRQQTLSLIKILTCSRLRHAHNDRNLALGPNKSGELKRTWSASKVQIMPYFGWLSIVTNVSKLLFWLQVISAHTCVALCLFRLVSQDYGVVTGSDKKNRRSALNIFYGLSLAEALLFILEKMYWQWKIVAGKLLAEVNGELGFDRSSVHTVRCFFYDAYSRSVNGSIFDGLKMDFISFGVELVMQPSYHAQLTGATVLSTLASNPRFAEDTIRKIGTTRDVTERLVEILDWKNPNQQQIRLASAEIVCRLVRKNTNCIRIAGIPGSLESVCTLLDGFNKTELNNNNTLIALLGLRILKSLAKDHVNCAKIANARDLLPRIVGFVKVKKNMDEPLQTKSLKLSLQLLKLLASSPGLTGKHLRKEILEIVYTVGNLRDVIVSCKERPGLQLLAVETINSLALEGDGREKIGATGGVIGNLIGVFLEDNALVGSPGFFNGAIVRDSLLCRAGEALSLLALQSPRNCRQMLCARGGLVSRLVGFLSDPVKGVHAARILRNLCAFVEWEYAEEEREEMKSSFRVVMEFLMMSPGGCMEEAAMGLTSQLVGMLEEDEMAGYAAGELVERALGAIARASEFQPQAEEEAPCLRRFSVELAKGVLEKMKGTESVLGCGRRERLRRWLKEILATTSEMERYVTFSGSVGVTPHSLSMHDLVLSAIHTLERF